MKRITKADLPLVSELPRYGVDIPVPTSIEELKCEYNEDERTPLVLAELEGYCVPPEGIVKVWVNGVGARHGVGPMMYPAGTFREDKHTINKEFGTEPTDMLAILADKRMEGTLEGIRTAFKKRGLEIPGQSTVEVHQAVVEVVMDKIFDDASSREALKLLNKLEVMFFGMKDGKEEQDSKLVDLAGKSMDELGNVLTLTEELAKQLREKKGEVIEVEVFDVTPPED